MQWLRENGRYLAPNGAGDVWFAAAAYQRNFLSIHVVLALLLLGVMALGVAVREIATRKWNLPNFTFWSGTNHELVPSIAFYLPAACLAVGAVWAALYWVIFPPFLKRWESVWHNRTTQGLANCLGLAALTVGIAALDTVGSNLFVWYHDLPRGEFWTTFSGIATACYLGLQKVKDWLHGLSAEDEIKPSTGRLILVGALVVGALWLVSLSFAANALVHHTGGLARLAAFSETAMAYSKWAFIRPGFWLLVVSVLLGLSPWFVNLSSLASLYSARLTRAYLGASNPARRQQQDVTQTIPGDQLDFHAYFPHRAGGPLHLINVTINQTADSKSAVVQFDRKGLNLAVGPVGLSTGVQHHCEWNLDDGRRDGTVTPIAASRGFHLFQSRLHSRPRIEMLPLGRWVGISGAAFTTGLGAQTNPALSFLLGFFNVRLGWWWNSGVWPRSRPGQRHPAFRWNRGDLFGACFGAQAKLLDEMRAHFCGPARRHWYLSDGGHFENTAAYELIRRRLPFIVICDDGCDPDRQMEDFANLVRKARLDFDAEITVLNPADSANQVPAAVQPLLGTLQEVSRVDQTTGYSPKAGLLARAVFQDNKQESLILLLKPTVIGVEPVDLLNYQAANKPFPQQTTMDQFFDEAQWESYRKLGDCLATALFAHVQPGQSLRQAFG